MNYGVIESLNFTINLILNMCCVNGSFYKKDGHIAFNIFSEVATNPINIVIKTQIRTSKSKLISSIHFKYFKQTKREVPTSLKVSIYFIVFVSGKV